MNQQERPVEGQPRRFYESSANIPLNSDEVLFDLGQGQPIIDSIFNGQLASDRYIETSTSGTFVEISLTELVQKCEESLPNSNIVLKAVDTLFRTKVGWLSFADGAKTWISMGRWDKAAESQKKYERGWADLDVLLPQFEKLLADAFKKHYDSLDSNVVVLVDADRDQFNQVWDQFEYHIQNPEKQPKPPYDYDQVKFVNWWRKLKAQFNALNEQINDPEVIRQRQLLKEAIDTQDASKIE